MNEINIDFLNDTRTIDVTDIKEKIARNYATMTISQFISAYQNMVLGTKYENDCTFYSNEKQSTFELIQKVDTNSMIKLTIRTSNDEEYEYEQIINLIIISEDKKKCWIKSIKLIEDINDYIETNGNIILPARQHKNIINFLKDIYFIEMNYHDVRKEEIYTLMKIIEYGLFDDFMLNIANYETAYNYANLSPYFKEKEKEMLKNASIK